MVITSQQFAGVTAEQAAAPEPALRSCWSRCGAIPLRPSLRRPCWRRVSIPPARPRAGLRSPRRRHGALSRLRCAPVPMRPRRMARSSSSVSSQNSPRTSYGYIKPGASREGSGEVSTVAAFVEKPDLATAERYVSDGYLWNSGNFLFRADAMLEAFRTMRRTFWARSKPPSTPQRKPTERCCGRRSLRRGPRHLGRLCDHGEGLQHRGRGGRFPGPTSAAGMPSGRFFRRMTTATPSWAKAMPSGRAIRSSTPMGASPWRRASRISPSSPRKTRFLVLPKARSQDVKTIAAQIEKLKSAVPSSQRPSFPKAGREPRPQEPRLRDDAAGQADGLSRI